LALARRSRRAGPSNVPRLFQADTRGVRASQPHEHRPERVIPLESKGRVVETLGER